MGDNNKNNSIVQNILTGTEVGYRKNFLTTKGVKPKKLVKAPPQFLSKSGFQLRGGHFWRQGLGMPW